MAKKGSAGKAIIKPTAAAPAPAASGRPSALLDTRIVYCGDNLEQLARRPDHFVDLIYIDPPFNSNRNYEVFWGETNGRRVVGSRLSQKRWSSSANPSTPNILENSFGGSFDVH